MHESTAFLLHTYTYTYTYTYSDLYTYLSLSIYIYIYLSLSLSLLCVCACVSGLMTLASTHSRLYMCMQYWSLVILGAAILVN